VQCRERERVHFNRPHFCVHRRLQTPEHDYPLNVQDFLYPSAVLAIIGVQHCCSRTRSHARAYLFSRIAPLDSCTTTLTECTCDGYSGPSVRSSLDISRSRSALCALWPKMLPPSRDGHLLDLFSSGFFLGRIHQKERGQCRPQ
jgi:hypothetical protein